MIMKCLVEDDQRKKRLVDEKEDNDDAFTLERNARQREEVEDERVNIHKRGRRRRNVDNEERRSSNVGNGNGDSAGPLAVCAHMPQITYRNGLKKTEFSNIESIEK